MCLHDIKPCSCTGRFAHGHTRLAARDFLVIVSSSPPWHTRIVAAHYDRHPASVGSEDPNLGPRPHICPSEPPFIYKVRVIGTESKGLWQELRLGLWWFEQEDPPRMLGHQGVSLLDGV